MQRQPLGGRDVLVMSYEHLRADAEWVAQRRWLYAVLDEGHAIRSPKSKIAQAARRIDARHRLLLSGTPVQASANAMNLLHVGNLLTRYESMT